MNVTKNDILAALSRVNIKSGNLILFHSSLKSLGYVEGGAESVIEAFLETVAPNGTVAVPTLVRNDFENAYSTWYPDKPSDVGYITEVFRKMPTAFRSDQETHSVAAIGPLAEEITCEHKKYGVRYGVFGTTPFSHSSPWQKMYDKNAAVLLLGVDMTKNTFKHLIEYILAEQAILAAEKRGCKESALSRLRSFESRLLDDTNLIWPGLKVECMEELAESKGLIEKTSCGNAILTKFYSRRLGSEVIKNICEEPSKWFPENTLAWFNDAFGGEIQVDKFYEYID